MKTYRYDPKDLRTEWIRVGLALASTAVLMAAAFDSTIVVVMCLAFLALILVYVSDLLLRQHTEVTVSDTGIELTAIVPAISKRPLRARRIAWADLKDVRLKFFPTRRDRETGWFELALKGDDETIKIQNALTDFPLLVTEVFAKARERDALISPTSEHNFGYFTAGRGSARK
jgi:hypothetical protein